MTVTIYVEGGGNSNHTKTECRKGFRVFLSKLLPNKQKPKIIASGGRSEAYRDFQTALKTLRGGVHILLLVDSEDPIDVGTDPWDHFRARPGDKWDKPLDAHESHAHLMVQCMEAWFLADHSALTDCFGVGFKASKLPPLVNGSLEAIPRNKIEKGLNAATKATKKQRYEKTRDGFDLLARV